MGCGKEVCREDQTDTSLHLPPTILLAVSLVSNNIIPVYKIKLLLPAIWFLSFEAVLWTNKEYTLPPATASLWVLLNEEMLCSSSFQGLTTLWREKWFKTACDWTWTTVYIKEKVLFLNFNYRVLLRGFQVELTSKQQKGFADMFDKIQWICLFFSDCLFKSFL